MEDRLDTQKYKKLDLRKGKQSTLTLFNKYPRTENSRATIRNLPNADYNHSHLKLPINEVVTRNICFANTFVHSQEVRQASTM